MPGCQLDWIAFILLGSFVRIRKQNCFVKDESNITCRNFAEIYAEVYKFTSLPPPVCLMVPLCTLTGDGGLIPLPNHSASVLVFPAEVKVNQSKNRCVIILRQ